MGALLLPSVDELEELAREAYPRGRYISCCASHSSSPFSANSAPRNVSSVVTEAGVGIVSLLLWLLRFAVL